ncbi:hypothetical protein BB561_000276 [Smittium simulii]|uniref:mRNA stability protein n=1 Tax=Smittium simulii TaxID=133385 RepID=A0A2T9YZV4_9FUNG|nr:hypothetical protein BB561_000276 [Smittium simulii]
MLPARQQKIDTSKLSEEEMKKFKQYGILPANKNLLSQRIKERKYFDSGDYALSRAGKTGTTVGEKHPSPDSIPHQHIHPFNSTGSISIAPPGGIPGSSLTDSPSIHVKDSSPPKPPNSQIN